MSGQENKGALERVFEAAGCRRQTDLADLLEIKQSSISDAQKKMPSLRNGLLSCYATRVLIPTGF